MELLYPFFVAFFLIFISELGDKTQLLVLSFSHKTKPIFILSGVALGTFFSHGMAILFGSSISLLENDFFHIVLEILTYLTFLFFGFLSFIPKKQKKENTKKSNFFANFSSSGIGYLLVIAFSIIVGEIGDKTFLASLGLGISYPSYKISLITGAIAGMVFSDFLAISFGKFLNHYLSERAMQQLSGILFFLFGIVGFIKFFLSFF